MRIRLCKAGPADHRGRVLTSVVDALLPSACFACDALARAFCGACDPFGVEAPATARASFVYEGPLAVAIRAAKYGPDRGRALGIARFFAAAVAAGRTTLPAHDAVAFVPAHWRRRLVRGFDFPALLARSIARREAPLVDALRARRLDPRLAQAASAAQRDAIVAGRFLQAGSAAKLAGRTVLLVDDVLTTGATLREASRVLAEAGAHVMPWALAGVP